MKRIVGILIMVVSFGATAQTESGMFFDLNMGTRIGGATSNLVTLGPGFHAEGGIGYMFNNYIGIRGHLGYNKFNSISVADQGIEDKSFMVSTALEAVIGVSQLAGFGTEKFDLYFHTGVGFNTFGNKSYKDAYREVREFEDRMFKGNDESFHIRFGLNPKVHINDKISLNLDATYALILGQGNSIDRNIGNIKLDGENSGISTLSLGLTYRL